VPLFRGCHDAAVAQHPNARPRLTFSEALRRMLNALVTDLMQEMRLRVDSARLGTLDEVRHAPGRLVALSPPMEEKRATAKTFLYDSLYNSPGMEEVHAHAERVVEGLFGVFMRDSSLLPEDHRSQIPAEGLARTVTDYIAGMTDNFIEQTWADLNAR
jgi:dGTPase